MFYYYVVEPVNQNFTGIVLEILGCLTEPWNMTKKPPPATKCNKF